MRTFVYSQLILFFCFLIACGSNEPDAATQEEISRLNDENKDLRFQLLNRDSVMSTIIGAYGAIDSNLKKVEAKKARISALARKSKLSASDKREIKAEMDSINLLLQANKTKVADLQMNFSEETSTNSGMSVMLRSLTEKNEVQDGKIVDMKQDLAQISEDFSNLFQDYVYKEAENLEMQEELSSKEEQLKAAQEKLYSAWYVIGTDDELKSKGIVYKGGLFDSKSVNEDFEKSQFKKINISEFKEIILDAKKAKIITTHPSDSYELVGIKKKVNRLVIKKPEQFWSVSKFLIIEVER